MSDAPDSDQKTQAPSAKRRRDAAAKGDVLQSRELATALVMAAGVGWMALSGPHFVSGLRLTLTQGLALDRADLELFEPGQRLVELISAMALPFAALLGLSLIAAVAAPAMLGSLGFRANAFAPKANRLDPSAGFKRMFGAQGLIELVKAIAKVALLGAIGWWIVGAGLPAVMRLSALDPSAAAAAVGALYMQVAIGMAGALGLIGLVDVPTQFFRRLARLRMTQNEVKDEHKETDGSPETKMMARQRRHEILGGSARRAVTEATVILTNPTHFAVALRYRPDTDAVPMVVARGRGETALAIRALAREAAVPQLDYPQLARAIYFTTRAGQPIAADLYLAVATILAFVFNLDRAMAEGATQPSVVVPPEKAFDQHGRRQA